MTIRAFLLALPALFIGWIAVLSAVTVVSEDVPAYLVVFPDDAFLQDLPNGVAVVEESFASVTLVSPEPDLAVSLYKSGALLVLPAGLKGCAPTKDRSAILL